MAKEQQAAIGDHWRKGKQRDSRPPAAYRQGTGTIAGYAFEI